MSMAEAFYGNEITANFTTLMRQASMTADDYLSNAIADVEKRLGEGAAKKYPQIVAAYMQAAATDLHGSTLAQQMRLGLDGIAEAITNAGTSDYCDENGMRINSVAKALELVAENIFEHTKAQKS